MDRRKPNGAASAGRDGHVGTLARWHVGTLPRRPYRPWGWWKGLPRLHTPPEKLSHPRAREAPDMTGANLHGEGAVADAPSLLLMATGR